MGRSSSRRRRRESESCEIMGVVWITGLMGGFQDGWLGMWEFKKGRQEKERKKKGCMFIERRRGGMKAGKEIKNLGIGEAMKGKKG